MVATRQTPKGDFPAFEPSPSKKPSPTGSPDANSSPTAQAFARRAVSSAREAGTDTIALKSPPAPSEVDESFWCHTASNLTMAWLWVSVPLVLWDCSYILLRPHTFEGGALQWPLWKPYEVYAAIDKVYSRSAWDAQEGFAGAQGVLNAVELVMYGLYMMIVYNHGVRAPTGTGLQVGKGVSGWFAGGVKVRGSAGNRAVLIGFAAAVMTLSKTVLYYFNEYFSGFASIKHNDWLTILYFYGFMNGLWVVLPAYMTAVFGADILQALDFAAGVSSKKTN
ncbi:hypothetical protein ACEQ8H_005688 [Pleosporales sp. CAS-2024a]